VEAQETEARDKASVTEHKHPRIGSDRAPLKSTREH
jgi:hypothetical protein